MSAVPPRSSSLLGQSSPAQYPAGSGVGVSVLLRQPSGLEGSRPVVTEVPLLDRLTVAERPHVPGVCLNLDAARLPPTAYPNEPEHRAKRRRAVSTFSCDIAYSERPTASRAAA